MDEETQFERANLLPAEQFLLEQDIARDYFQGELYDRHGMRLSGITLDRQDGSSLDLDERATGRLFMIPDGSSVWAFEVGERGDAPAGVDVRFTNPFLAEDEQNSIIAFRDEAGPALYLDALHINRMMLAQDAPQRLTTVAFGLMSIIAFPLGFHHISLFAAGNGPLQPEDPDAFIGYDVWPKFGFDAEVHPAEMNAAPTQDLVNCRTVQDVLAADPEWWSLHGTGRMMSFDLAAGSRSWQVLLNYLYEVLPFREEPV